MDYIHKNFHISKSNINILRDWYTFNVLQRVHMNYIENIHLATGATLAAGIYQPKIAAYVGIAYIVGR